MLVETFDMVVLTFVPTAENATMAATDIKAAIKAYSMTVAPFWIFRVTTDFWILMMCSL